MPSVIVNGSSGDDTQIALVSGDATQAAYNYGQIQVALSRGGYIQFLDAGVYHVLRDDFALPVNTQVFLATGVQFAIGGVVTPLLTLQRIAAGPTSPALVTTWANRPTATSYGQRTLYVSDVGIGGSYWYSDGVQWRPVNGHVTIKNLTVSVSNSAAPKIVMDYATIPAGLVTDGDILRISYLKERTGGVADTDATDIMLGAVALTLGTTTGLATSALAAANIQLCVAGALRKESATTLRPVNIPGGVGWGAATVANAVATVPNMNTQTTYLQITSDLTTAGGETAWLRAYTVELLAGS
jgi:hypothetical protein